MKIYNMKMPKVSAILLASVFLAVLPVLALAGAIELTNPLKYDKIEDLIEAIIDWLFTLALLIVPMVIVLAGYFFITSAGDPQKVATARKMVIYALVGLLIIMISKGTINLIRQIIGGP